MIYPNHPKFITVAEFDTHGRYINVAHAFLSTNSTVDAPSYNIGTRQTPQLVPHLAPQGKDWLWIGDTWQLHDDFKDVDVYDKRTAMRTEPPIFGQPLADHMTLKAPPHETGKVTYWDSKAIDWAQRTDHTGIQCWSTVDPRQSMVLSVDDLDIPEGYTTKPQPTPAHDWDAKKGDWVINKTKLAELDRQEAQAAFEQAKAAKTAEINNLAQAYIDHATGADKLPAFEVQSWAIQGAEAKAWKVDPTAPTPTLDTIANARGLPLDALRAGAYKKTMLYEGLVAAVTGQRQKYNDLLRAAKTAEAVNAIIVVYGAA